MKYRSCYSERRTFKLYCSRFHLNVVNVVYKHGDEDNAVADILSDCGMEEQNQRDKEKLGTNTGALLTTANIRGQRRL